MMTQPKDKHGRVVNVGTRVRVVQLSAKFLESLPEDEVDDVRSMIGEVFVVDEIDEYGCPWVMKEWPGPNQQQRRSHSVALDASEMEVVNE